MARNFFRAGRETRHRLPFTNNMHNSIISHSLTDTLAFAKEYLKDLHGGDVLCLHGDLGAGKTAFVKGLGLALGITEELTSPTFALLNVYPLETSTNGISELIHIDAYRLKNPEELIEIGGEDYLQRPDTLTVIEWPEKADTVLNRYKTKHLRFTHRADNEREVEVL